MLLVWKSTVKLFPLVSEPAFKGMRDRTKLMLEVFLKRDSCFQLCEGPARCQWSCALAVCLTLQWYVSGKVLVQQAALRAVCTVNCYALFTVWELQGMQNVEWSPPEAAGDGFPVF